MTPREGRIVGLIALTIGFALGAFYLSGLAVLIVCVAVALAVMGFRVWRAREED